MLPEICWREESPTSEAHCKDVILNVTVHNQKKCLDLKKCPMGKGRMDNRAL